MAASDALSAVFADRDRVRQAILARPRPAPIEELSGLYDDLTAIADALAALARLDAPAPAPRPAPRPLRPVREGNTPTAARAWAIRNLACPECGAPAGSSCREEAPGSRWTWRTYRARRSLHRERYELGRAGLQSEIDGIYWRP